MRLRVAPLVCFVALALGVLVAPASAADTRRIGPGASAAGTDVSGLTVDAAARRLAREHGRFLGRDVVAYVGARRFRVRASRLGFRFDALTTAKRAYHAARGRDDSDDALGGGGSVSGDDVALALTHSRRAVRSFAAGVERRAGRRSRNAAVRITVGRMVLRRSRVGRTIAVRSLARRISAALEAPRGERKLRSRVVRVRPRVTVEGLRRAYPTVLSVDRGNFKLRLFKRLRFSKGYGVAVGMAGLDTPPGRYRIQSRQINPAWHVPDRDWAGALRGQVIPGGRADNPLKARWLGIANGVGIHGTGEEWTIGSRASHGCIRMRVADVKDLYPRVPVGTPVLIR